MESLKKYKTIIFFILLLIIGIILILFSNTFSALIGYKSYIKELIKIKNTPGVNVIPNYDTLNIKFEIFGILFALYGSIGLIIEGIISKHKWK